MPVKRIVLLAGLGSVLCCPVGSLGGSSEARVPTREDVERMLNASLPSQELRVTYIDHRLSCHANGQLVRFRLTEARAGDFRGPPYCPAPNGLGRCDALSESAVRSSDLPGDREVLALRAQMREAGLLAPPTRTPQPGGSFGGGSFVTPGLSGTATRCTLRQAWGCTAFARWVEDTAVPAKIAPEGGLRVGELVRCQVRLGRLGPARVTGIRSAPDGTQLTAEYSREWQTDASLDAFVRAHPRAFTSVDRRPISRAATLRRYDEGWRIESH